MITVITGTPGAGKTLHAIEKLLLPLVGKTITVTDPDGQQREAPRTIYTNINGLLIEHELIEVGGEWVASGNTWEFKGNEFSARNWHQWAKPGAVIVVDEAQKMWPPRANGAKVPPDVQALDTHRHMGVDFVLITQSVMNTDRHIHALGGRHLHVRRVANMRMAVVYEWDHVSRSLQYSKAISKGAWRYSRKVFKLYRSAEVHTKQPRKLPGLVWFILAGLGAGVFLMPTVYDRFGQRFNPTAKQEPAKPGTSGTVPAGTQSKPAPGQQPSAPAPQAAPEPTFIDDRIAFIPRLSGKPETAPAYDAIRKVNNMPLVTGGACFKGQCKCYTQQGTDAGLTHGECRDWMTRRPFDPYTIAQAAPAPVQQPAPSARPSADELPAAVVPMPSGVIMPRADVPGYGALPHGVRFSRDVPTAMR